MNFKKVIEQQRSRALAWPCEHAEQCLDPRYFFRVNPAQEITCGVNLTVNVGQE